MFINITLVSHDGLTVLQRAETDIGEVAHKHLDDMLAALDKQSFRFVCIICGSKLDEVEYPEPNRELMYDETLRSRVYEAPACEECHEKESNQQVAL